MSTMRINGSTGTAAVATTPATRRPAAAGFTLGQTDAARAAPAPTALRTIGGIDALIALQGIEGATERRRHAVKRGRLALDALDELKIGLLGGELSPATLGRLKASAALLKDCSGDTALDGVLGEIELRVEVELAKMAAA
jgi:Class II flagellar assembly regulator